MEPEIGIEKNLATMLLEKGFLIESSLVQKLQKINPSVFTDLISIIVSVFPSNNKWIYEKDFVQNIDKINIIFNNLKSKRSIEQQKEIETARNIFSDLSKEYKLKTSLINNPKEIAAKPELILENSKEEPAEDKETFNEEKKIPIELEINSSDGNFHIKNFHIPTKKFAVEDFVLHFKNRFEALRGILQNKPELENLTSISKLSSQKQKTSIIGMVFDKYKTKNKNILLKIEDLTGQVSVLVSQKDKELLRKAENIVDDEVIGLKCFGNSEILFATDICFPDISTIKKSAEKEEYAVFISDIHLGSNNFLEENFTNFINWLNLETGSESQKEIAKKIKYLFIVGDNVDGVGVFPGQEKLLTITDLTGQYEKLGKFLDKIRKEISIFMCPGQHDASRLAEPQPPISPVYAQSLYNIKNLFLVTNPSLITISKTQNFAGLKVLMYHGASFINIVNELDELRISRAHDNPTRVIKTLLKRRHLAPSHSFTTYLPAVKDPLLIYEAPDIIATGDFHKAEVSNYNNILLIASSCWQTTTPFEEKVGNHPDPCKVPILNLKTGQIKIMDFT